MIRFLYIILLLSLACNNSPNSKKSKKRKLTYEQTLTLLFPTGRHQVNYVIHKEYSDNQKKVLKKFNNALRENKDYMDSLYENLNQGKELKYSKQLGMSKVEFDTFLTIFTNKKFAAQKGVVTITQNENTIRFNSYGELSVLDSLVLLLKDSAAFYKNNRLAFGDTLTTSITGFDNEYLESPFVYKSPNGLQGLLSGLAETKCRLVIARQGKSGKTFLDLKGKESSKEFPVDVHLSLTFD